MTMHFNRLTKLPRSIAAFYLDGFKQMTVGRTLWIIILLKLFIMFAILKIFLFQDFLSSKNDTEEGKADFVRKEMTRRN